MDDALAEVERWTTERYLTEGDYTAVTPLDCEKRPRMKSPRHFNYLDLL